MLLWAIKAQSEIFCNSVSRDQLFYTILQGTYIPFHHTKTLIDQATHDVMASSSYFWNGQHMYFQGMHSCVTGYLKKNGTLNSWSSFILLLLNAGAPVNLANWKWHDMTHNIRSKYSSLIYNYWTLIYMCIYHMEIYTSGFSRRFQERCLSKYHTTAIHENTTRLHDTIL